MSTFHQFQSSPTNINNNNFLTNINSNSSYFNNSSSSTGSSVSNSCGTTIKKKSKPVPNEQKNQVSF